MKIGVGNMPRSLFEDMTQKARMDTTMTPKVGQLVQPTRMLYSDPVQEAEYAPDARGLKDKFMDVVRTPITPNATLQLAQLAAAIAPEGTWQSRLAQTVGGQVQQQIDTTYMQDVLAGREPTAAETKGVPLDVQLGARRQRLGEEQQAFEQERRVGEFDIKSGLEQMGRLAQMMTAEATQQRAMTDQERMKLEALELDYRYPGGARRQYADFGGVGLYNIETGEYMIDPTLLALRKKMAEGTTKDDLWGKVLQAQKEARATAKQRLVNDGSFLVNKVTGEITGIKGDPALITKKYEDTFRNVLTSMVGEDRWQIPLAPNEIESLIKTGITNDFDVQQYLNPGVVPPPPDDKGGDTGSILNPNNPANQEKEKIDYQGGGGL
jgi:hypothetical protein